jgi:hypothetical protein
MLQWENYDIKLCFISYNQWSSGILQLSCRLAVVSWLETQYVLLDRALGRDPDMLFSHHTSGQLAVSLKKRSERSSVEPPKRPFFRAGGLLAIWLVESNVCINMCISIFVVC